MMARYTVKFRLRPGSTIIQSRDVTADSEYQAEQKVRSQQCGKDDIVIVSVVEK